MIEENNKITTDAPIIQDQRGKMTGVVVNNVKAHEGTVTVLVKRSFRHKKYHKIITTSKKYLCEYKDKESPISIGAQVVLRQIAPVSKRKYNMIESIKEVK